VTFQHFHPWGHKTPAISTSQLVAAFAKEAAAAIADYAALPVGPIPCDGRPGFSRVSVEIPISTDLFDQLMNGESGYRARYAAGVDLGEDFNRLLVSTVAPLMVAAEHLYADKFDRNYCRRSLLGTFSKFWYSKNLTDPSAQNQLLEYAEELLVPHWKAFWSNRQPPRKGLLAPMPENPTVLLNGTFVDEAGAEFEQKPGRSLELHQQGWT
jgi:hypothetical protein